MSRNINICINKQLFQNINGFENIDINNLNSLINYSVNTILLDNLNLLETDNFQEVIGSIFNKVAVGGQMVIRFIDAKLLAKKYVENLIDDKDFIVYISAIKSILTVENICSYLDANFVVDGIDQSDFNTMIKIMRTNIK
jgi:hypothetical protein